MEKYTVQNGDTLSAIGRKYGVSYQDIAEANGIKNPDLIYAGDTLVIPTASTAGTGTSGGGTNANGGTTTGNNAQAPAPEPTHTPEAAEPNTEGNVYEEFQPEASQKTPEEIQAEALLAAHNETKPGAWIDPYLNEHSGYLDKYENRDPFSYDFNADALYQQYKDQYIQQGQMAMMDTMGQAAAMTGGYGNSYAQTAGQQAYNMYLGRLNEVMPELYGMAYDRYQQEGQDLLNMYSIYKGLSDQSYTRYQDEVDAWYRESERLTDERDAIKAENERAAEKESEDKNYIIYLMEATGYEPTDEEREKYGFTQNQVEAHRSVYTNSQNTTTGGDGGTDDSVFKPNHVSSVSTDEIIEKARKYGQQGDNQSLDAYLTGLVMEGRISEDYAISLYATYKSQENEEPIDTTVEQTTTPKVHTNMRGGGGGYKSIEDRITYT